MALNSKDNQLTRDSAKDLNIGVIGLGYVGLTLGIAAANSGIVTYGVEINPLIKQSLSQNKAHFFEPGLDDLIEDLNNRKFFCVEQFPKDVEFDAFVITVGTPLVKGEKEPNKSYIKSALESLADVYTGNELIILRSTVAVGTTRNVVIPTLSSLCGKPDSEILASMCPERTVEGKAVEELATLPQVISGNNDESLHIAREVFGRITPSLIEVESLEAAELTKLYCNTYRDIMFAVGNVFCMAAQEFGVDGSKIIEAANEDYVRSNICKPGFVAGPCLEKDAYILTSNMPESSTRDFILKARAYNESLEDMVVGWVARNLPRGSKIALSGMAFKGVPETSDLRGSSSVNIARKLKEAGFVLKLHDFVAYESELKDLELGEVLDNLDEACKEVEALIVLNNHANYKNVTARDIKRGDDLLVLDTWSVCDGLRHELRVDTLGTVNIAKEGDR